MYIFDIMGREDEEFIIEAIQEMIDNEEDLDIIDTDGSTLLHRAISLGSDAIAELLINAGVNLDIKDREGFAPLISAIAVAGEPDIAIEIIKAGGDINTEDINGRTATELAIMNWQDSVVKALIDAGVDMNQKSENGDTLLYTAIDHTSLSLAHLVLGKVDLNKMKDIQPIINILGRRIINDRKNAVEWNKLLNIVNKTMYGKSR